MDSLNCAQPLWSVGAPSGLEGPGACAYAAFDCGHKAAARLTLRRTVGLTPTPNELLQSKPPTN